MRIAALILLLGAGFPVHAEFLIARAEKSEPATSGDMYAPAIASSANGFLVAWIDRRPPYADGHVRAMRLDDEGQRIDERDFEIAPGGSFSRIAVASDGRDYLLAYSVRAGQRAKVRFVRVPAERGAPPEPLFVDVDGAVTDLAYTNGFYAIATSDALFLLDAHGKVTRAARGVRAEKLCAARDGRLLLAWSGRDDVQVALVHVGDLLDPQFSGPRAPLSLGSGYVINLAEGAHGFGVLLSTSSSELVTSTLDEEVTTASPRVTLADAGWRLNLDGRIARLGSGYVVTALASVFDPDAPLSQLLEFHIAIVRLDAGGRPLLQKFESLPYAGYSFAAAPAAGATAMLAFAHEGIHVQRLSLGGSPMLPDEGVIASMSRASQQDGRIARCVAFDVVTWKETERSGFRLMMRRFAPDGTPLGPAVRLGASQFLNVSVTCGRTTALVAWVESTLASTAVARGAIVGENTTRVFPLPTDAGAISVAFDGSHYVVAAMAGYAPSHLIRLNEEGVQAQTQEFQTWENDSAGVLVQGALGWNGEEILFVFQHHYRRGSASGTAMLGYRFKRDLSRVGPAIVIREVASDFAYDPIVAASPDAWLVGWSMPTTFQNVRAPFSSRVLRDGTVLDPRAGARLGSATTSQLRQVSWSGSRWELVTEDRIYTRTRDGATSEVLAAPEDVRLQALAPSGDQRLMLYLRVDPVDGVYELYGDSVDMSSPGTRGRRRSARP